MTAEISRMNNRVMSQQFGNYRLLKVIGQGGFAQVYLAEHIYLKTQAAIKVLYDHLVQEEFAGFLREAQMIASLKHPHIIPLFDFGVDEMPYLAMEYLPQGSLRQRHARGSVLPLSTIIPYVNQIAAALQFAHDMHVIHRDVKPENLLVNKANSLVLSDFGIATQAHRVVSLQTVNPAGSVSYMAPEQISGKPLPASDQYALGCLVYEWLCGFPPFQGDPISVLYQQTYAPITPLRDRVASLPAEVEMVVLRALSKDPGQRFPGIQAFATALQQAVVASHYITQAATVPLANRQPSNDPETRQPGNPISRRSILIRLGLAGLTVTGIDGFLWFSKKNPPVITSTQGLSLPLPSPAGQWQPGPDLLLNRDRFRATLLKNGMVLVEGGRTARGQYTAVSELFNPATNTWMKTGDLRESRSEHTATLLQDGTVLVAGGGNATISKTGERYDPLIGSWSLVGEMHDLRTGHTATLLTNGQVLITGGWSGYVTAGTPDNLASGDIYDPAAGTWTATRDMTTKRKNHVAVLLPDGTVLVTGGSQANIALYATEIYDPRTNEWTLTGNMVLPRVSHNAVYLEKEQQVLVMGGLINQDSNLVPTATAELYDLRTQKWSMTSSMSFKRPLTPPAIVLPNQTVLVIGADALNAKNAFGTCEIYHPTTKTWTQAAMLIHPRIGDDAVLLQDNRHILIAGGSSDGYAHPMFTSSEIWTTN
jgi:serine/threonine protein kinase